MIKNLPKTLILVSLVGLVSLGFPSPPAGAGEYPQDEIRASQIWDDIKHVITSPARMDLKDGAVWLGIFGATGILYTQDDDIRSKFQEIPRNSFWNSANTMGDYLGDGYYMVPAIGIIGIGGYLFKYPPLVRITIETLETMLLAGLASAVLKIGVGRARPNREDHDPSDFDPFNFFDEGFHSFPSGHALVGGSIAGVLAQEFDCVAVDILAYTLVAGLTVFHRIYDDKHWASDVFFGSALGVTIGQSITRNRQERGKESPEVLLLPDFSHPDYSALRLTILF